jgi:preprotein translocase subunit SecF
MRHALVLNAISAITFLAAVFFLVTKGLHLSVEFTGGTVMEISYQQTAPLNTIRADLTKLGYQDIQVQNFGSSKDVLIRLPLQRNAEGKAISSSQQSNQVLDTLKASSADVTLKRVEFVGPQVGKELATDGLLALLFVILGIVIYLSIRFEWKFAVAGILANLHDVVIILGFFALFQWEFSLSVLAAVLAVLGYSVNESVVIFDRIRENFRKYRKMEVSAVIDNAITSTTSRTIITHGSTQMMVLAMLLFGGPTLYYFSLALTIGILFGIYSSVFVAAALAMWFGIKREDLVSAEAKANTSPTKSDDPNFGAQV